MAFVWLMVWGVFVGIIVYEPTKTSPAKKAWLIVVSFVTWPIIIAIATGKTIVEMNQKDRKE